MNERQKQQAIEYMKKLDMDPIYINEFATKGKVYVFDQSFDATEITEESVLMKKLREIELSRECIVYAVTHEDMIFGECYSFLMVSKYEEDWSLSVYGSGAKHAGLAYVWNVSEEWRSESGSVMIQSFMGRIRRIG